MTTKVTQNLAGPSKINAQTGTTYTAVITDHTVTLSNAGTIVFTVPANSAVAFPIGHIITVWFYGAGIPTITFDTGVTGNGVSAGSGAMSAQYGAVSLLKIGTDEWLMAGSHAAVA